MGQFLVLESAPNSTLEGMDAFSAQFSVFPNPASDRLTIKQMTYGLPLLRGWVIRDILGKVHMRYTTWSPQMNSGCDVSGLANGVYLLELQGRNGERGVLRFMKE